MRRHAALLLALLVLGAGCSNILPWSHSEPSPPTENAVEYPPGTNAEWILSPDRLLTAHRAELDRSAYGLDARVRPNRSTGPKEWANSTLVVQHGTERTRIHETGDVLALSSIGSPYTAYRSGGVTILRANQPNGDRYRYQTSEKRNLLTANRRQVRAQVRTVLSSGDFLANGTETRDGTTLFRYNSTGDSSQEGVRSVSATVLLDENGMIHELRGSLRTNGEYPTRVSFSFSFARVAHPPSRPEWTDRVPHIRVDTTEGGVFRLDQTGGASVPAGTRIVFSVANESSYMTGSASLAERLSTGDSAYLSVTNVTDGRSHPRVEGTFTTNGPSRAKGTLGRIVPGSGYVTIGTER